jgi:hypothetical protein
MNRRNFLKKIGLGAIAAWVASLFSTRSNVDDASSPNLIGRPSKIIFDGNVGFDMASPEGDITVISRDATMTIIFNNRNREDIVITPNWLEID